MITQPSQSGGLFSLSVATLAGKTYTLEFKNALTDPSWSPVYSIVGNGTVRTLTDTNSGFDQRFYRVNQSN